jgi:hypothetical protein
MNAHGRNHTTAKARSGNHVDTREEEELADLRKSPLSY